MLPRQGDDRTDRDSGSLHVEQNEGDPRLRLAIRPGPHEAEHPVGPMGMGGPDLGPIQDVAIAFAFCAELEGGEVGACARL